MVLRPGKLTFPPEFYANTEPLDWVVIQLDAANINYFTEWANDLPVASVYLCTGKSVVYIQPSEESRHQSDTGRSNCRSHKYGVYIRRTHRDRAYVFCFIWNDSACGYFRHQRGGRNPSTSIRRPRSR